MKTGKFIGLVWVAIFLGGFLLLQSNFVRAGQDLVTAAAQQCLEQTIPGINRGGMVQREGLTEDTGKLEENPILTAALRLTEQAFPAMAVINPQESLPESAEKTNETKLQTGPGAIDGEKPKETAPAPEKLVDPAEIKTVDTLDSRNPAVLIYHTHATESYQPVNDGNFHSIEEYGTVREVGNVLALELEKLGYEVIHDKTVHDSPSYNQSYSRSLSTAKTYLKKYPNLKMVIDLHRDAAGYTGNMGKTASIGGKTAATYGFVVGKGNPNLTQLYDTVKKMNQAAEKTYPGFTGRLIEKEYKFNQYISDHHVLIEVGNNENTIEQAKNTGALLAPIIAEYLRGGQ